MSMTVDLVAPHDGVMADDPAARLRRRRFSPEYKLAILAEYDRLTEPGDKGALLRREGLYTCDEGTTSWRSRSRCTGGWRSRSTSWPWRSDARLLLRLKLP